MYHGELFLDDLGREKGRVSRDTEILHEFRLDFFLGVHQRDGRGGAGDGDGLDGCL